MGYNKREILPRGRYHLNGFLCFEVEKGTSRSTKRKKRRKKELLDV